MSHELNKSFTAKDAKDTKESSTAKDAKDAKEYYLSPGYS